MEELPINSQLQSFLRHCAQHAKQGIVAELDCGVVVCWTQSTYPFMNAFFLSTVVADELDLRRRLEEIKVYVMKMQPTFPWVLIIEPERLPPGVRERLQEICLTADFVYFSDAKCMQTTRLLPPVRPLPAVEIKFITSQQDIHDAALLNVHARNLDASVAENVVEHRIFVADFDTRFCCIVSVDGEPVATATTRLLDECLYVGFVATLEQHRKHGYAEVAMRASIDRALEMLPHTKHGIVLYASKLGQPVFERMGFKDISYIEIYNRNW